MLPLELVTTEFPPPLQVMFAIQELKVSCGAVFWVLIAKQTLVPMVKADAGMARQWLIGGQAPVPSQLQ